jgi:prepilin-type N-terminal cleavage/methylation domain-containing protein
VTRRADDGFTLLELLIVIFLIVLITGVFATSIGGGFGVHLRNSSRSLAAELEYVSQRAVTTGRTQRVVVDLDHQVYRVEMEVPPPAEPDEALPTHAEGLSLAPPIDAHEFLPVEGSIGAWHALDDADDVSIRAVKLGDESRSAGAVAIGFSTDGSSDPAEIWLRDGHGYDARVRLVAFTGEIRIEEPELAIAK